MLDKNLVVQRLLVSDDAKWSQMSMGFSFACCLINWFGLWSVLAAKVKFFRIFVWVRLVLWLYYEFVGQNPGQNWYTVVLVDVIQFNIPLLHVAPTEDRSVCWCGKTDATYTNQISFEREKASNSYVLFSEIMLNIWMKISKSICRL